MNWILNLITAWSECKRVYIKKNMCLQTYLPEGPGPIPLPYHKTDLCLVVPDSTPSRFVNSQLINLRPVGIFNKFLFNSQYLFANFSARRFFIIIIIIYFFLQILANT